VARAYLDQLARGSHIEPELATRVADELDAAEGAQGGQRAGAAGQLEATADVLETEALAALTRGALGEYSHKRALLAAEMRAIAASMR
jgi:hypothetical protein